MIERSLPDGVVVLPGTDVAGAWGRFEVFEALHHGMRICNPMRDADLAEVVEMLAPCDGERMLDIACGHGELLIRAAHTAAIHGIGIDLSPWAIVRAFRRSSATDLQGVLEWRLGDAHELDPGERHEIVTCLGASWIWHGFRGTAAAVVRRTVPGGRIAVGDLRLRDDADPDAVAADQGKVLTAHDQAGLLDELGVDVIDHVDAGSAGWDGYDERTIRSVESWADEHPGPGADEYLAEQARWRDDHLRDREFLEWTVWVGRLR
jgi:SAM-dependent methyltransferase